MQKTANKVRKWLKANGFNHSSVKVMNGNVFVIENLYHNDAAAVIFMATGRMAVYMTQSMAKIID